MYKATRRACRMRWPDTPGPLGRGRSSDKEARTEFPVTTRDSDIVQPSPCYQQGAWGLNYSECTKPRGVYVGCDGLTGSGTFGERKEQ